MLVDHLGLPVAELAGLREYDRSATGYLPRAEFEVVADLFFAHPHENVHGWEKAIDAQRRIICAIEKMLINSVDCGGDVAIVAHGGVGTLLLCHRAVMLLGDSTTSRPTMAATTSPSTP